LKLTKKPTKKKKEDPPVPPVDETVQKEADEQLINSLLALQIDSPEPTRGNRMISLFGEIEEEKCGEIAFALRYLAKNEADNSEPIELLVSTHGGSASDMFAVYDTMRVVREDCEIITTGIGKVMSAGVLLLASGSKGKRRIGANCRIMLHGVASGHVGQIYSLENELEEVRWTQDQYIKALAKETDMTQKYIKKLIERHVNVYLTASEAVELGIADEVF
jgi:ATP-dependent Clp protease protease subunit